MSGKPDMDEDDRSATLRRAWEFVLQLLSTKVNTVAFESFIRSIQPLSLEQNVVNLGVHSSYQKERLDKSHLNAIRSALEFHLDTTGLKIEFTILTNEQRSNASRRASTRKSDPAQTTLSLDSESPESEPEGTDTESVNPLNQPRQRLAKQPGNKGSKPRDSRDLPVPCMPLNERYQLGQFLIGDSNRLAYAGAQSVAQKPGAQFNPLYIYGGPGLGKTHLLQGITHAILERDPSARVAFVSGEYFAQSYFRALRDHATDQFRRQYREVDVWIVDDVQFIVGKAQTNEEFFHTFNSLFQSGKQIVIASDRSPRELTSLDERLRSRFQSGLIADINPPDTDTRVNFLKAVRRREDAEVADDVLHYIADAIQSNMRSLEGALTRLMAYSSIMNAPMSADLAHDVLGEYFITKPVRSRTITIELVIRAVASKFGASEAAIKGPGRNKDLSIARQVAMLLCRDLISGSNVTTIGAEFGGRDHATVVYACQRVRTLLEIDPELKSLITELTAELTH